MQGTRHHPFEKKNQIRPEVKFAEYVINGEGTKQDPKFIKAITDFPAPTNLTDLRSLMGLVNRSQTQHQT